VKDPLHEPEGPYSWVFFIVAKLGTSRHRHHPLAVAQYLRNNISDFGSYGGCNVPVACERLITTFSDPANRTAIEGELALAADFYNDGDNAPRRVELPNLDRHVSEPDLRQRRRDRTMREFPFISTCLLVAIGLDHAGGDSYPVLPEPLGTVYRDSSIEYGMVVVDISDVAEIRYGIIGFTTQMMIYDETGREDNEFEDEPAGKRSLFVEEDRPRRPLSAAEYTTKFGDSDPHLTGVLAHTPLVDHSALDRKTQSKPCLSFCFKTC
jgi:hypothetical protein